MQSKTKEIAKEDPGDQKMLCVSMEGPNCGRELIADLKDICEAVQLISGDLL